MTTTDRRHPHEVEKIPFYGRTWYKRGVAYWLRRALAIFIMLLGLTFASLMTGGTIQYLATTTDFPLWLRVLLLIIAAAAIVHSTVKAWSALSMMNRARRKGIPLSLAEASGEPKLSYRERRRQAIRGSSGWYAIAMLGGGGLLAISVVFNFGWFLVLIIISCQKYTSPEEFAAWQKINHQHQHS